MAKGDSIGSAYLTLVPKLDTAATAKIEAQLNSGGATGGKSFSSGLKSGVSSGVSTLASVAKTGLIAAGAAAATGIAATVGQAFSSAADYEQLIGGVETLFGSSADTVSAYAQQAYQTCGISANQYMEQATSFAASLVSSLGGDQAAAAEYANMAMQDMADNANKMGTDMSSIQNAYQGFAKQNYTMLDNLKLGYGGTKEEMQRLLEDAQAISGVEYDISSYADVVAAINTIQTNMGITGTTANEAASTVSGSIGQMKAAWSNFAAALGTGEGIDTALDTLMSSVGTAASNIIPLLGTIFSNVGNVIATNLPTLVSNLCATLTANAPTFLQSAVDFMLQLVTGIGQALPSIIAAIPQLVASIAQTLWDNKGQILQAGITLIGGLVEGIGSCLGQVGQAALDIVNTIGNEIMALPNKALQWGADIIQGIADGIWNGISAVGSAVSSVADTIASFLHFSEPDVGPLSNFHTFMPDMIALMSSGIKSNLPVLAGAAEQAAGLLDFSKTATRTAGNTGTGVRNMYVINGMNYLPDSAVAQAVEGVFTTVLRTQRMGV